MGNLSNGDHGQGKYCFSSLPRLNVNCYKVFQNALSILMLNTGLNAFSFLFAETLGKVYTTVCHFVLLFSTRLSFTRTKTSRVGAMSAAMTAQTFTRTSAAATPSGWRVAAS